MPDIRSTLDEYWKIFHRGATRWSTALYGTTALIAVSSALAGVLPKLGDSPSYENLGLALGVIGAVAVTLASQIRFAHKRAANRTARTEVRAIMLELDFNDLPEKKAAERLISVLRDQAASITGPLDEDLQQKAREEAGSSPRD